MGVPVAFGWRHVLFANWPVDADVLAAHLPVDLSVEQYDGTGWLSVTPLVNVRLRPRGLPGWTGITLPEVNLRTYVTVDDQPGVYFFSLDAGGVLSVIGARLFHHLPYFLARVRWSRSAGEVRFSSRRRHPGARPARFEAAFRPTGEPFEAEPGSLAAFLTERRRLYTQSPAGDLRYTDVRHDPWPLFRAATSIEGNTLVRASGFELHAEDPRCYYSPGVDVVTSANERWE